MDAYLDLRIGSEDLEPFGSLPRIRINKHIFSAGERHVTIKDLADIKDKEHVCIIATGSSVCAMEILQANDILKRNGIEKVSLYMPYFYYSRQDRATTPESSFALKLFCQMLDTADLHYIYTHDLHSYAATEILNNIHNYQPVEFLQYIWSLKDYDYIIAPDKGAAVKINSLCDLAGISSERIITATKVRDPATGQLGSPNMSRQDLAHLHGNKALIFDDICDGGYTFIQLAKYIKERVDVELDIGVTHGIFSRGIKQLQEYFDKIYTTDSMPMTFETVRYKHRIEA